MISKNKYSAGRFICKNGVLMSKSYFDVRILAFNNRKLLFLTHSPIKNGKRLGILTQFSCIYMDGQHTSDSNFSQILALPSISLELYCLVKHGSKEDDRQLVDHDFKR